MKAIEILLNRAHGRPVDRVNQALKPENVPWSVVSHFACWLREQMPARDHSALDPKGRKFTTIANEYLDDAGMAACRGYHEVAFGKVRMLALLHIEAVGFGKAGRNAHRAHLRELLRLCRAYTKTERHENAKTHMATLYGVLARG